MNRFVIANPTQCIGCNTCMAACSTVHRAQGLQSLPRLTVTRSFKVSAPVLCRHCEDAPCGRVCPVDAITIADQHVVLNEQTCVGCKMCALACPFGAITPSGTPLSGVAGLPVDRPIHAAALNPVLAWEVGVRTVAVKCDLCAFQDAGPECIRACPTNALKLMDDQVLEAASGARRLASVGAAHVGLNAADLDPTGEGA